jgi:hypothetical protein
VNTRRHHPDSSSSSASSACFDTFRSAHLEPRHAKIGLGEAPGDLAEFRAWPLRRISMRTYLTTHGLSRVIHWK